jgi:hypothetical protein
LLPLPPNNFNCFFYFLACFPQSIYLFLGFIL